MPRLSIWVYATNMLDRDISSSQVVGQFVRMQEEFPIPQRASLLYFAEGRNTRPLIPNGSRRAEHDHVLKKIMPSIPAKHCFVTATTSLKYIPYGRPDRTLIRSRRRIRPQQQGRHKSAVPLHDRNKLRTSITSLHSAASHERPASIITN